AKPVKEVVGVRVVRGEHRGGHDRTAFGPDRLPEARPALDDANRRDAHQHGRCGVVVLAYQPFSERFHHRPVRCGLLKPSRARPARTSGTLMKSFQSRPVRWFSIMTMMGP